MQKLWLPIVILILSAGIAYLVFTPTDTLNSGMTTDSKTLPPAVAAVKAYAALQFSVPEDNVTIVSTEKQNWDTLCLGLVIEDKDYVCEEQAVSGYEVALNIKGQDMKYRASEDGQIVRFVKN